MPDTGVGNNLEVVIRIITLFKKPLFVIYNMPSANIIDESTWKFLPFWSTQEESTQKEKEVTKRTLCLQIGRIASQIRGKERIIKRKARRLKCHRHKWRNVEMDVGVNVEKLRKTQTEKKMIGFGNSGIISNNIKSSFLQ